jgi:hypothetical protein
VVVAKLLVVEVLVAEVLTAQHACTIANANCLDGDRGCETVMELNV